MVIKEICVASCRFILSDRCMSVFTCQDPEKRKCWAIVAEIIYLRESKFRLEVSSAQIDNTIDTLRLMTKEKEE